MFEEYAHDVHIDRRLAAKSNMADVPENAPERKIKLYSFPLVFSDKKSISAILLSVFISFPLS